MIIYIAFILLQKKQLRLFKVYRRMSVDYIHHYGPLILHMGQENEDFGIHVQGRGPIIQTQRITVHFNIVRKKPYNFS